jgi:hypothetical protein
LDKKEWSLKKIIQKPENHLEQEWIAITPAQEQRQTIGVAENGKIKNYGRRSKWW